MISIALDVDQFSFLALLQIALELHHNATGDGAVRACISGLGQAGEFEWTNPKAPTVVPARPAPAPFKKWRRESSIFIFRFSPDTCPDAAIALPYLAIACSAFLRGFRVPVGAPKARIDAKAPVATNRRCGAS